VDWWLEFLLLWIGGWNGRTRSREIGSPAIQPIWISAGVPLNCLWIKVCGLRGLWVKLFGGT